MPRKGRNTVELLGDDDDDMGTQSSQGPSRRGKHRSEESSQGLTQSQKASEKLGRDEFQRKVSELVRYLLCQDKKKVPIKRQDINKNVMKEHAKAFPLVFEEAKKYLSQVFGFDVIETETSSKVKVYILVNKLEDNDQDNASWNEDSKNSGLLMILLSLIFMSENELHEDMLRRTLKRLGIQKEIPHKEFGDVDKAIQEFVKQQQAGAMLLSALNVNDKILNYIVKTKIVAPEGATYRYKWGLRSNTETTKRNVLTFISEMYGVDVKQWKSQYKEIVEEEQCQET